MNKKMSAREIWRNEEGTLWLKELATYGETCPKIYGEKFFPTCPEACDKACAILVKAHNLYAYQDEDNITPEEFRQLGRIIINCGDGKAGGKCGQAVKEYLNLEKTHKIPAP